MKVNLSILMLSIMSMTVYCGDVSVVIVPPAIEAFQEINKRALEKFAESAEKYDGAVEVVVHPSLASWSRISNNYYCVTETYFRSGNIQLPYGDTHIVGNQGQIVCSLGVYLNHSVPVFDESGGGVLVGCVSTSRAEGPLQAIFFRGWKESARREIFKDRLLDESFEIFVGDNLTDVWITRRSPQSIIAQLKIDLTVPGVPTCTEIEERLFRQELKPTLLIGGR